MSTDDACQLVVDLTRQVCTTALERDAHRLLAVTAIGELHKLTGQHDRLREQHRRLIDEYRSVRAARCASEVA